MENKKCLIKSISVLFVVTGLLIAGASLSWAQSLEPGPENKVPENKISQMTPLEYEILMFEKRTNKLIEGIEKLLKNMEAVNSDNMTFNKELNEKDSYIEDIEGRLFKNKNINDQAKGELSGYHDEIETLKSSLIASEEKTKDLLDELEAKNKQVSSSADASSSIKEKDAQIIALRKDNESYRTKAARHLATLRELQTDIVVKDREYQALKDKIKVNDKQANTKAEKKVDLVAKKTNEIIILEEKIAKYQKDLKAQEDLASDLQARLQEKDEETASLKEAISIPKSQEAKLIQEKQDLKKTYQVKQAQVNDLLVKSKITIDKLKADIKVKDKDLSELSKKVAYFERSTSGTETAKDRLIKEREDALAFSKVKRNELKSQINEYKEIIGRLKREIKDKNIQVTSLTGDNQALIDKKNELLREKDIKLQELVRKSQETIETIDKQKLALKGFERSEKTKNKQLATAKKELDSQIEGASVSFEKKDELLQYKVIELKSLRGTLEELNKLVAKKMSMIGDLQSTVKTKDKEIALMRKEFSSQNKSTIRSITKKDQLLLNKDNELSTLKEKLTELNMLAAKQVDAISGLEKKVKAKDKELVLVNKELNNKGSNLSSKLTKKDELLKESQEKNKMLTENKKSLNKDATKHLAVIKEVEAQLESKNKIISKLKTQLESHLNKYSGDLGNKDKILAEKTSDILSLTDEIKRFKQKMASLKEESSKTTMENAQLGEKLDQLQSASQVKLSDQEKTIVRLKGQLATKEKQLLGKQQDVVSLSSEKEELIENLQTQLQEVKVYNRQLNSELKSQRSNFITEKKEIVSISSKQINDLKKMKKTLEVAFKDELSSLKTELDLASEKITVSVLADVLFASGSNELKPSSVPFINKLTKVFEDKADAYNIIIEGHTDSEPIQHSLWKSNWELSSARALSVLHFFINEGGFDPGRLSFGGYGEHNPVARNDTRLGRKKNRRVEIILLPKEILKVRKRTKFDR